MKPVASSDAFSRAKFISCLLLVYYALESQFWAYWWIIFIFPGFFIIMFFIVILLENMLFWVRSIKDYDAPYVPFTIQVITVVLVFCIPSANRSKQYHINTYEACDCRIRNTHYKLYKEFYCVGTGYLTTNTNAQYLTDSLNFRIFLGTYEEGNMPIWVTCKGDTIETEKRNEDSIVERKKYSLRELKKLHATD